VFETRYRGEYMDLGGGGVNGSLGKTSQGGAASFVHFPKYNYYIIKLRRMSWAKHVACKRDKKYIPLECLKEIDREVDIHVGRRTILNRILKGERGRMWTRFI
jgi:hypothetical protein